MMLLNPKNLDLRYADEQSRVIMQKIAGFFENKGIKKIKEDDHNRIWYVDFLEFVKKEKIFSNLLTPTQYGKGTRWDTWRNCKVNEILGFYGLAYWYTWQVTILGLGPIWMSCNEEVKKKTAELLLNGGIFAFGLSEKEHGADLYSSGMTLIPQGSGKYLARGSKYYIGNANEAGLVSVFGKIQGESKDNYVFFVVNPKHEKYELVQNVCNSQNYVAEFKLNDYPITEKEILSKGAEGWDASLNTVNIGKFNLGWASIGICSHAFYEAIHHASNRHLFDKAVTDFVHIKQLLTDAYARLLAMKLFALRASDYMRSASKDDRRYLLYNPIVKMKVTTQGEEVIDLLWDVIAAKGFEKDLYFEMATRDIRALPKLEGTVHVNMALIIKFMRNYFFKHGQFPDVPQKTEAVNDDFLFAQGPAKDLGKIRFHDYRLAYDSVSLPNVRIFKKQIRFLKTLLLIGKPNKEQIKDFDFLLNLGELFTLVAYGQLIIESAKINSIEDDVLDQIFDFMVRDFSKFALRLYSKTSSTRVQMLLCRNMIKKPVLKPVRFEQVWKNNVYTLKDAYIF
ncbi:MAG: acyl-CoA dehydrogenase [Bdellovibrio sp.]|nr:acyl-CoA dehydrogenase [Bdellovibrio sp.]